MTPLELVLDRMKLLPDRTIGRLSVGDVWACWTLEDKVREIEGRPVDDWKIRGITAIPRGRYRVTLEPSARFGPDTLTLHEVPGFSYIRIHGGIGPEHTDGCLLVGREYREATQTIGHCAPALAELKDIVRAALDDGDDAWITVR